MKKDALIAEFIGTFALIFVGICAIANGASLTGVALAHGLTIAVMVSATGAVSGGHLNPAVTIGALTAKKIDVTNAIGYIIAQCLGGIVAALILKFILPAGAIGGGTPALGANVSICQGLVMEVILTFFLVFVIFGTAIDKRAPQVGGLFIGLTVALDILAGGPITGAAMNPARHFGPAVIAGGAHIKMIWLYWVAPVAGAILAAQIYHHTLEEK